MMTMNSANSIEFHGDYFEVVAMRDGSPGVIARRLVENIGLSWPAQTDKLVDPMFGGDLLKVKTLDGKTREMWIIPVNRIAAYLLSINVRKVQGDARKKLIMYQEKFISHIHMNLH